MQSVPQEATRLARRLRQLREQEWEDAPLLTQAKLAKALSAEEPLTAGTVSSWENNKTPKLPPERRLRAYARFFATQRSVETPLSPRLLPLGELSPEERARYEELLTELLGLRSKLAPEQPADDYVPVPRSWHFNEGPITLFCAELPQDQKGRLADPKDPNYTELQRYADIDSLTELHGHIRAENPQLPIPPHFRIPSEMQNDDLTGHIIIIGGVGWNDMSVELSRDVTLPVQQVEVPELDTGEIFLVKVDGDERRFLPEWSDGEQKLLTADVGLLARVPNPHNSSRTLTICNGIHSRGVYGAVRTLTDTSLRDSNERYIAANFGNSASFAILMRVRVIQNKATTPDFNSKGVVLYQWHAPRPEPQLP